MEKHVTTEPMNIPDGAILQRDKKSFAIVPRIPLGVATPENLENIALTGDGIFDGSGTGWR